MSTYTPASTGRLLKRTYAVQLREELIQREGRYVASRPVVCVSDKPTSIQEVDMFIGANVSKISYIRVRRGTYTLQDVTRRVRKLNLDISLQHATCEFDGEWVIWRPEGYQCPIPAVVSRYYPKSFTKLPSSPKTVELVRGSSVIAETVTYSQGSPFTPVTLTNTEESVVSYSYEDQVNHTWDSITSNQTHYEDAPVTITPHQGSLSGSEAAPESPYMSDSGNASENRSGNPVLTVAAGETFYHPDRGWVVATDRQYIYQNQNGRWVTSTTHPQGYNGLEEWSQTRWNELQNTASYGSSGTSSYQQQSGSTGTHDWSNPVYGNSGSSQITWSSGQTSQTVTAGGSVHTISTRLVKTKDLFLS